MVAVGKNNHAKKVELVISNLNHDICNDELTVELAKLWPNPILSVEVQRNEEAKSRGFALVLLDLAADGEAARIAWHGQTMRDRAVVARYQRTSFALNKQISQAQTWQMVLHIYELQCGDFNYVNISTGIHRLGKLGREETKRDERLLKLLALARLSLEVDMEQWGAREISNVAWGLSKMGVREEADGAFIANAVATRRWIKSFNPQDIANTIWAFASRGSFDAELFEALAKRSLQVVADFSPQGLANTVWSFAKAGKFDEALFRAIAAAACIRIFDFDPQNLANTAWAYAKADLHVPELFGAVSDASLAAMARFDPQAFSMLSWAFAHARVADGELFETVAFSAAPHAFRFTAQELSTIAWAFATAHVDGDVSPFFISLAKAAQATLHTFKPHELATVAWAFAAAKVPAQALLEDVAREVVAHPQTFKSSELAKVVWAFSTAAHLDCAGAVNVASLTVSAAAMFDTVSSALILHMGELNARDVCCTAWAYAAS
ncbi:hypothetical protein M885DRAFT_469317, partial [Pelagophyceae sp. CCMP2097]